MWAKITHNQSDQCEVQNRPFRIGIQSHEYTRRTGKKEVEVKKEARLIKTTITRNIYCKRCAALHKENWVENGDISADETANNQSELK